MSHHVTEEHMPMNPDSAADDGLVAAHALELADALRQVTERDLADLQRLAVAGIRDGIENRDAGFALVWRSLGRCARAERGRREQAVIDFADELDGPGEGCLADGWALPPGWEVEVPDEPEGRGYDGA